MSAKHIVVATDLSENSAVAERHAAELARDLGAQVTILHCYDPEPMVPPLAIPDGGRFEASIENDMVDAIKAELEKIRKESFSDIKDVKQVALRSRNQAQAICDFAEKESANYIVVGTVGRGGLLHILIGSVAERVVRHAPCSVVVAR